jgi:DUF1009 family protein
MSAAGPQPEALGLIAGMGSFPLDIARSARERGRSVVAVAFHEHTDPRIEAAASQVTWLHPGEVAAVVATLRSAGVRDAVLAGKVPKAALHADPAALRLDAEADRLIGGLGDRGDASILSAVADHLERRGIHLLAQAELVPELLAGEGPLGRTRPTAAQRADIAFGWPIAKAVAGLDVGQTVVVKDRSVIAVEAIEGTDAAIARAGAIAAGACAVKVARPGQDPRFDLPAIGPATLRALIAAGASALACEAGRTVVLDREALVAAADAHGIALVGVAGDRLPEPS